MLTVKRNERRLTKKQTAEFMSVTPMYYARFENNNLTPSKRNLDFLGGQIKMNFGILSKKRKNEIVNFLGVVNGAYYHLSYTVTRSKYFFLLIYTYDKEIFERLESKKSKIEEVFGDNLDWYSSCEGS